MLHRVLNNRYVLQERIGGGGMADVYLAEDQLLKRQVAVKVLHEQFQSDTEFIEKFHREAQAAARLSHPNIVGIYDVGIQDGSHFIVMEYVPGHTLKEHIKEAGHLPVQESLQIAGGIASALAHAHAAGLVHCDIKPHNILMMPDGGVKVADFGIARAVTESTMTYSGNVVGSVHYFSPEQAKGTLITPKSDVYSLGVVLYEMLTGQLPFQGETPVSIAMQHLQDEPRSVREIDASIPPVVEAVVNRTMSKDPSLRPTSSELVIDLRQAGQMVAGGSAEPVSDPYATQVLPRVQEQQQASGRSMRPAYREDSPEYERPFYKSKKFVLGLVMVLMAGFFVGAFMSFGRFWSTAEVKVPDVTGKPLTLARQTLEDSKLRVNVAEVYDANVPAGQVVSQDPPAGATVKEDRLVTINVSRGGEDLEMPDLKGLDRADAETKLKKMGLVLGRVYEKYSNEDQDVVIDQEPKAGRKLSKGATVDITVSKGKQARKTTVPNVRGGTEEAARSALKGKGLNVEVEYQADSQAAGTVVSQSPGSGTEMEEGGTVQLVVSEGRKPERDSRQEDNRQNSNPKDKSETDDAGSANNAAPKPGDTGKSR